MQTRRDLLDAYRLMTRRTGQALVTGDPDTVDSPLRRITAAVLAGVLVSALAVAAVALDAKLAPGKVTGLDRPGVLVIEKETGARYVRCGPHRLCPALNYVSARLAAGPHAQVRTVGQDSLTGFERGPAVGIPGAPDTLPDTSHLLGGAWSACVTGPGAIALVVGRQVGRLDGTVALPVLADGAAWVIQGGQRSKLTAETPAAAVQVPAGWLAAIPTGPDLGTSPTENAPAQPLCLGPAGVTSGGTVPVGGPVIVPAGRTALVAGRSPDGGRTVSYALLANGTLYPLTATALGILGYPKSAATQIPQSVLDLLPKGPTLSEAVAR